MANLTQRARPDPRAIRRRLRIGLVGTGAVAASHAIAIRAVPGVELHAVADSDRLKAEEFAAEFAEGHRDSCPAYGSLDEMATRRERMGERLDAVVLAVPDALHAELAIMAMRKYGLFVLLEKPPATTVAEAEAIALASEETGLPILLGLVYIHQVNGLEGFTTGDYLGHRFLSDGRWLRRRGHPGAWRTDPTDPVNDLGIHILGVQMHLHGWPEPTWVTGRAFGDQGPEATFNTAFGRFGATLDPTKFVGFDMAQLVLDFHDPDRRWLLYVSFLSNYREGEAAGVQIAGAFAGVDIPIVVGDMDPRDHRAMVFGAEFNRLNDRVVGDPPSPTPAEAFELQMAHFADVILGKAQPVAGAREIVTLQRVLRAAELSIEQGGKQIAYADI